jgi:hypothetical protein
MYPKHRRLPLACGIATRNGCDRHLSQQAMALARNDKWNWQE